MTTYVESNPDPAKTMVGLSSGGYTVQTALADIVDNSINARADNVWIDIRQTVEDNAEIRIWDDGYGMNKAELKKAMVYGDPSSDNDENCLGRFGFGLKTASLAISQSFDVVTRKTDSGTLYWAQWDLGHVSSTGKWQHALDKADDDLVEEWNEQLNPENTGATGTLVIWNNVYAIQPGSFDAYRFGQIRRRIREHLALVFHTFIEAGKVNIFICGEELEAWNPYALDEPATQTPINTTKSITVTMGEKKRTIKVKAIAHILPNKQNWSSQEARKHYRYSSSSKHQGIHVYREDRMIICGGWMGLWLTESHSNLCRFELRFDRESDDVFELNYMKDRIELKQEVADQVKKIFENARDAGNLIYRQRQSVPTEEPSHEGSSVIIDDTYHEASGVDIVAEDDGSITVTKLDGEFAVDIETVSADHDRIEAVDTLDFNALWEPSLLEPDAGLGCKLNMSHEFYRRVYFPLKGTPLAIKALDILLYTLAATEFEHTISLSAEQMNRWRMAISQKLEIYAAELPEHDPE